MPTYTESYSAALNALRAAHGEARAMELIVGGDYVAQGILEKSLLIQLGLRPSAAVVDIGCGSGRLAFALRDYLSGLYVGTDILPDALAYAVEKVQRPDWRFIRTTESRIPVTDGWADFICFFSVFTHLQDKDCYRYLAEAARAIKPGGLVVLSFLDFEVSWHWPIFQRSVNTPGGILNRFHAKSALRVWGGMLGLEVVHLIDGFDPSVELLEEIVFDDGRRRTGRIEFGQSVAVFRANAGVSVAPTIVEVVTKLGLHHRVA